MIQLKQNDKSKEGVFNVCIDEDSYSFGWAYKTSSDNNSSFQYVVNGERNCWALAKQTIQDFEPFSVITFDNLFPWMKKGHSVIITDDSEDGIGAEILKIAFFFSPNLAVWNEKYSFAEYFFEFNGFIEKIEDPEYDISYESEPVLRLEFLVSKYQYQLKEILLLVEKDVKQAHDKIVSIFHDRIQQNSIQNFFDFPEEIIVPCKQYLEYFVRFLKDLGISATSSLKEEVGKVLFSVTPTDDVEALDKIREALAVYLNLPASPIVYDDSFAAMRLQQQIENLQHSQKMAVRELQLNEKLLVAQSDMIRDKNVTISQQICIIEQKDKIIEKISSKSIMTDSLENKEKLYEGLEFVPSEALKKYVGIILQPVTFFKELGKNIVGTDEITSLDLDKKDTE